MKNSFKTFLEGALFLTLPMFLTSCDDILGEWSRPAPNPVEPATIPTATIKLTAKNLFQDPDNKVAKEVTVAKLTLKSACLPNGELVFDEQITSPASSVTVSIPNPPSGEQTYDVVAIDAEGNEWTAEDVALTLNEGTNPDKEISLFNPVYNPLTIEPTEDGIITITYPAVTGASGVKYTINGTPQTELTGDYEISVHAGDIVQFFSTNAYIAKSSGGFNIKPDKKSYVYGNVMSLIDDASEGFAKDQVINGNYALYQLFKDADKITFHDSKKLVLPATTLCNDCYDSMFQNCDGITTIPETFLPAKTLANNCYASMFWDCDGLTTLPETFLPATTLANSCYASMFIDCDGLTTLPEGLLPAGKDDVGSLAEKCYDSMFQGCKNLQKAPALPATTLKSSCYTYMFSGCISLTTAPELKAQYLWWSSCCNSMFYGCTKLSSVTCLAIGVGGVEALDFWLYNAGTEVTGTKTFKVSSTFSATDVAAAQAILNDGTIVAGTSLGLGVSDWVKGTNGIPGGWTIIQ